MHSDHCAKKLLPWFDGMLDADEAPSCAKNGLSDSGGAKRETCVVCS